MRYSPTARAAKTLVSRSSFLTIARTIGFSPARTYRKDQRPCTDSHTSPSRILRHRFRRRSQSLSETDRGSVFRTPRRQHGRGEPEHGNSDRAVGSASDDRVENPRKPVHQTGAQTPPI